jgi:hypothetical protein
MGRREGRPACCGLLVHHHTKFEGQITGKLEAFVGDEREEKVSSRARWARWACEEFKSGGHRRFLVAGQKLALTLWPCQLRVGVRLLVGSLDKESYAVSTFVDRYQSLQVGAAE